MSSSTTWNRIFLLTSRDAPCPCPVCGGKLAYRDSRKRIWQQIGGEKKHIMIPRFQCQNCDRYHNGLPDCLVPYKHYGAQEIEDVIDKVITPEDDAGDGPSFETMLRWLAWFQMNLERVDEYSGHRDHNVRGSGNHGSGEEETT